MQIRNSTKALIVRDGHLLAIKKVDKEGVYYLMIGGGQEHGETFHETLKRECMEEAGVKIEPGDLVFVREYIGKNHEHAAFDGGVHQIEYMFACELLTEPDITKATQQDNGQIGVEWLPLKQIEEYRLYPQAMRRVLKTHYLQHHKTVTYLGDIN
ncbi:MAG: NUDIX domain-containing protein [Ectobacillus sp.]